VVFGDGTEGARLPSGSENVVATYRSGIGGDGNMDAGKLTLLKTRPLGIRGVINPVPAKGGVEPETLDEARDNAPMKVLTLDRIVSLRDFEDFTRAFSGIGKAQAVSLWDGKRFFVNITAATSEEESIDPKSDLYTNLLDAINACRDPLQPVVISGYVSRTFSLSAGLIMDEAYEETDVLDKARKALVGAFAFSRRSFGQVVTAAEIIALIQAVPGVIAVDLDNLTLDGIGSSSSPATPSQKPAAILTAQQADYDQQNRRIIPAELLLINEPGITLFKKGKPS